MLVTLSTHRSSKETNVRLCRDCGSPSTVHQRTLCQPCVHKRNLSNRQANPRPCKFCGKTSKDVEMRPDRAVCRPCHRAQERERHRVKIAGLPICGACEKYRSVKGMDGMCENCFILAGVIDDALA